MAIGRTEIKNRVGYHPANDDTAPLHDLVRQDIIKVMNRWDQKLPDGREKSLAFTELQSAAQWANAASARHGAAVASNGAVVSQDAKDANDRVGAK
jgi:hypothetical protein